MLPIHVALTTLTPRVSQQELARVAAALQVQVTRDFAPLWHVDATVSAFAFDDVPIGYWPIIVQDVIEECGAAGVHRTEDDEAPYVLVRHGPTWSLTASHELLELLADPTGARRIRGDIPGQFQGNRQGRHHGPVQYLLEVCAPCEDIATAYGIDGVVVSDFCTPAYFASCEQSSGRYSFSGSIRKPLQVLANGYLTWFGADGLIYQARADAAGDAEVDGGYSMANRDGMMLREFVNNLAPDQQERLSNAVRPVGLLDSRADSRAALARQSARLRDDLAWRFGYARHSEPPMPRLPVLSPPMALPAGASRAAPLVDGFSRIPVPGIPVHADPVHADPVHADPVRASPVRASTVRASPVREREAV